MLIWKIRFWPLRANKLFIFSVLKWQFYFHLCYFFFLLLREGILYYMFYIKWATLSPSTLLVFLSQCCSFLYFILCRFFYPRVFPPDKIFWFIRYSRIFYFSVQSLKRGLPFPFKFFWSHQADSWFWLSERIGRVCKATNFNKKFCWKI